MGKRYHQPAWATVWKRVYSVSLVVGILIVTTHKSQFPGKWISVVIALLQLVINLIWITLFNDIKINKSGIQIQIYQLWWISIPWDQIVGISEIRKTPRIFINVGSLFWQKRGGGKWMILQIRKLPMLYHLASWVGIGDVWAGILLPPQMVGRDELVVDIQKRSPVIRRFP